MLEAVEREAASFRGDADAETRLLEAVKQRHEALDHERRAFEDLEFRQMEREAQREAEKEDITRLVRLVLGGW